MNALNRFSLVFLLGWAAGLNAQHEYPVAVSGIATPPYSLNLEEYVAIRPEALSFFITLNDPVEPFREVYLRLAILHNGEEILFTDPNYQPTPIVLQQFQTEVFDGARLAPYLQVQNLVGIQGGGGGSILPEGNNKICLEVVDRQRNVPISGRYCLTGNFQRSLPPQPQMPANRAELPKTRAQNLIFKWNPKQMISGNPPGPVDYTFTLVEVLPGITNPNDAFSQGIRIFETTQPMPSLLYSESFPPLEPGKWYAWRVQARAVMGYDLFENDGWSEVFSFRIYDDGGGALSAGTSSGALHSGAGRNCAPFSVDFGPVPHRGEQSASMAEGETIWVGFFEMEITQVNSQSNGYSGKGFVIVPFLKSKIKVHFRNLKISEDKRAYEVGGITAEIDDPRFSLDPGLLSGGNIAETFNPSFLNSLSEYLESPRSRGRFVSHLSESVLGLAGLPLVLDKKGPDGQPAPPLIVMDMSFGVREARMTALSFFPAEAPEEWIAFLAPRIGATPYGIQQGVSLNLIGDVFIPARENLGLLAHGGSSNTTPSSLACDCTGYTGWNPSLSLVFPTEFLMYADSGGQVALRLTGSNGQLQEVTASAENLPPVAVAGLPGFRFEAGSGSVDFSPTYLLPEVGPLPPVFDNFKQKPWQGAFFRHPRATLPPEFNFTGADQPISLPGEALFIDEQGLSGRFAGDSLASLEEGRLGGWPCSIDHLYLDIRNSRLFNSGMRGKIRVPVLADAFPFEAGLHLPGEDGEAGIRARLQGAAASLPMWRAGINLSGRSEVVARLRSFNNGQRQFLAGARLDGMLNLRISDTEMEQLIQGAPEGTEQQLRSLLGIGSFGLRLENLELNGLRINPFAEPEQRFQLEGYEASGARLAFGEKTFPVHSVQLKYRPGEAEGGQGEEIGLMLTIKAGGRFIHLGLWGRRLDKDNYVPGRISVDWETASCNCSGPKEKVARLGDFPLEREGRQPLLRIPFLDDLRLEMAGNTAALKALWKGGRTAPPWGATLENLNEAHIETLLAEARPGNGSRRLPYDLTPHLPAILGVDGYLLPGSSRLILIALEADREGARAGLLLYSERGETALPFIAEGVSIGPNSLGLAGLELRLLKDVRSTGPALPVTFRKGGLASFSCNGLASFALPAVYQIDPGQLARPGRMGNQPLSLEFIVQGRDPFEFIAPLNMEEGAASFVMSGEEGQLFHLKSGYADFSATDNPTGMPDGFPASFSGLYFEELELELEGFQGDGPGGNSLVIPCRDFFYLPGEGLGLKGEINRQGLFSEQAPLNWGGWLFTIDDFRYRIANNTVEQKEVEGRLRLPNSPDWPWMPYRLTPGYDTEAQAPTAQLSTGGPAFRAFLAQEGIMNYSTEMRLSENDTFLPALMVDGSLAAFHHCLRLDGRESLIRIDSPDAIAPSYTKEAWICLNTVSEAANIMSGRSTRLGIISEGGRHYLSAGHNGNWNAVRDPAPLSLNNWHHVAVSYDASTQRMDLYRDGKRVASGIAPLHSETQQFIGGMPDRPDFHGRIAEMRIWNRPRSPEEIQAFMNREAEAAGPALAAYYRLGEGPGGNSLRDHAGNGHAARMINMDTLAAWSGMIAHNSTGISGMPPAYSPEGFQGQNLALRFDGQGGHISLGRRLRLDGRPFTIEFWARRTGSGEREQYLAGQGFRAENRGLNIGFRAGRRFVFDFHGNALQAEVPETDDGWHHWACAFSPEAGPGAPNRFIYRDGELLASDSAPAAFQGSGEFFIGAGMSGDFSFNGYIDEFRIWQAARSPEEIRADMGNSLAGRQAGLLACYPMNEGPGTNLLRDHSGRGNTGMPERFALSGNRGDFSSPALNPQNEQAALSRQISALRERANRARLAAQDIGNDGAQAPVEFRPDFQNAVEAAAREAERAAQLAGQLQSEGETAEAEQAALSQAIEAAAMAEAAARDARSLAQDVRFYPEQGSDYAATWDEDGNITIRYRNFEAFQRVKHILATDNPYDSFHWDTWSKSHFLADYTREGSGWKLVKSVKGFPFPGQVTLSGSVVRLACHDNRGKTAVYEAARPITDKPVVLEVISVSPTVQKTSPAEKGKILLLAETERYQSQQKPRLRLEHEDGSPATGASLVVINGRQEKVIEGKIKGRRKPRFIYARLRPDGATEKVRSDEAAFELEAGKPYLALLKNKKGRMATAGLDSSFWNNAPLVEFSGFQRPAEANRKLKEELQSRFEERLREERQKAAPPVPLLKPVQAAGAGLALSWEVAVEGNGPLQLELYRRKYNAGADWELIHSAEASGEKTYTDASVAFGQRYEYALQAVRPNGLASGLSQAVTGQLPFDKTPYSIESLSTRKLAGAGIQLNWTLPAASGDYEIQLYRSSGAEAVRPFARLNREVQQFIDSSPAPGAVYNYAVQAILKDGRQGERSAVLSIWY